MSLSVDDIVGKFPHKKLPTIQGEPTYASINDLMQIMYANAASVPTTLGGGSHGHIGLVMKASLYATLSPAPFLVPPAPGPFPQFNPNVRYTQAQRDEIVRQHKEATRIFENCTNTDLALKAQLCEAVQDVYLEEKRNRYTGYLTVPTKELMDHLLKRYGKITDGDLQLNKQRMNEPMDPSLPIDMYFKRIDDCMQYAADAETPYTEKQILQTVYHALSTSGLYNEACTKWRKRNDNTKTWNAFKTTFASEYHDLKEQQHFNAPMAGYHTANAVAAEYQAPQQLTEALDQLAMATTSDRSILSQLTQANAELTKTNKKLVDQMTEAVQALKVLADADTKREEARCIRVREYNMKFDPEGYCWTHGYKVTPGHNSCTCTDKKPGHKDAATRANPMGGSQKNKDWKHPTQM